MRAVYKGQSVFGVMGGGAIIQDNVPIGTIISYMGTTAPTDYLVCDGAVYNISEHPDLAAFFATQFGTSNYFGGDGTATFAVPDMRNLFLRGYHGAADLLSGDIGGKQEGTFFPRIYMQDTNLVAYLNTTATNIDSVRGENVSAMQISMESSSESNKARFYTSRPVNMAVLFCIKATKSTAANDYVTTEQMTAAINAAITGAMEEAY